jgi:hypothetical protein
MVDKVAISPPKMRWLDKGGVQPKLILLAFTSLKATSPLSTRTRFLATIDPNRPPSFLNDDHRHIPITLPFRLCNSISNLSTPWRSVEWYSLSPCVASWTLH